MSTRAAGDGGMTFLLLQQACTTWCVRVRILHYECAVVRRGRNMTLLVRLGAHAGFCGRLTIPQVIMVLVAIRTTVCNRVTERGKAATAAAAAAASSYYSSISIRWYL